MKNLSLISILLVFLSTQAMAWGGRGHATICEASAHLVKNQDLKDFLTHRTHILGHLCNIPDTHWRNLGPGTDGGASTHYFEPDLVGLKIEDTSTDYKKVIQKMQGLPNKFKEGAKIFSVPKELGSSWWRAEQFVRLATQAGKVAKKSKAPTNRGEEQNNDLEYNKAVYSMLVNLGVMGHFVGDTAQPFHNTADYDGWGKNHGGIHGFYEEVSVAQMSPALLAEVVKLAQESEKTFDFLKSKNPVENMKKLAIVSYADIETLIKLDELIKPSSLNKDKGMEIKTPAERPAPAIAAAKFKDITTLHMARAAALLAKFWDQSYEQAGKPNLKAYRSYKFPFQPDFVEPDYYEKL